MRDPYPVQRRAIPLLGLIPAILLGYNVCAASLLASATDFSGKVIGITDGDTITVLHNGRGEKIRLNAIDCPKEGQAFAKRAKQLTSALAFGNAVTVVPMGKDRYGRTVADVLLPDGRLLNHLLVKAGVAWWYRKYALGNETLRQLEAEARREKRGLWADKEPVPPWDWRGTNRPRPTLTP